MNAKAASVKPVCSAPVEQPVQAGQQDSELETRNKRWRDKMVAEMHAMLREVLAILQTQRSDPRETELLSVGEIARRWSVSQRTVWRMIRAGRLPSTQVGASRRVRLADVVVAERERQSLGTGSRATTIGRVQMNT